MLKVVIADDEARVCSLIKMLIDWQELDMELAGTASNGLEALELVKTCRPDILITDIRMPGCCGIELIEKAKQELPQLEIVIISGYAHFEYAQSAIRHGVGDYLLKPINKQELMDTLKKLGDRCRSRSRAKSEVESLRKSTLEDQEQFRARLLEDLFAGRCTALTEEKLWESYRFRPEAPLMQMALLVLDYDPERFSPATLSIIKGKAEALFHAEVEPACRNMILLTQQSVCVLLLSCEKEQLKTVRRQLRRCLSLLDGQRAMFAGLAFSLAVGPAADSPAELPEACEKTKLIAMERLVEGTGRLLEHLPPASKIDRERALHGCHLAAEDRLEYVTAQQIEDAVSALEEEVRASQPVRGSEIYALTLEAGRLFLQRPEVQEHEKVYQAFEETCRHAVSVSALFDALHAMMTTQLARIAQQQRDGAARPIRVARQYVQQHYHEPITLEQVCEATGFSVSYFSALFKKETGEGFVKYLTRVRMEHARELLQQTNLSISEICVRVGYNDIKHFTQTFKKETNLNPGQYRKLYG